MNNMKPNLELMIAHVPKLAPNFKASVRQFDDITAMQAMNQM